MTYVNCDLFLSYLVFVQVKDVKPLILFCILLTKGDVEDNFELKIESIVDGCNDIWVSNQERMCGQQSFPLEKKKLSEAVFIRLSPCQARHVLFTYQFLHLIFFFYYAKPAKKGFIALFITYNRSMIVVCNCGSLKRSPSDFWYLSIWGENVLPHYVALGVIYCLEKNATTWLTELAVHPLYWKQVLEPLHWKQVLGPLLMLQELDGVCHENNWVLPTYHLSQSDGKTI